MKERRRCHKCVWLSEGQSNISLCPKKKGEGFGGIKRHFPQEEIISLARCVRFSEGGRTGLQVSLSKGSAVLAARQPKGRPPGPRKTEGNCPFPLRSFLVNKDHDLPARLADRWAAIFPSCLSWQIVVSRLTSQAVHKKKKAS